MWLLVWGGVAIVGAYLYGRGYIPGWILPLGVGLAGLYVIWAVPRGMAIGLALLAFAAIWWLVGKGLGWGQENRR